jgi:hypothetical protein
MRGSLFGEVLAALAMSGWIATGPVATERVVPTLVVIAVVDMMGDPMPGARVEARQTGQPPQVAETSLAGFARVWLRPGSKFDLRVSHDGFTASERKGLSLESKGPTVVGVALALRDPCPVDKKAKSSIHICM